MDYCLFHPKVRLLLLNHSDEKVPMVYDNNPYTLSLPMIGPRPPYYTNPRYVQYDPVI